MPDALPAGSDLPPPALAPGEREPPVVARFRWTADDLLLARRIHFRHQVRPSLRYALHGFLGIALFTGVGMLILSLISDRTLPFAAYALILVGMYWFTLRRLEKRWWTRRSFRKRPDRDIEVVWEATRDRIAIRSVFGSGEYEWRAFAKLVCTPAGALLYPTDEMFHWVPRTGFASDAEFERFVAIAKSGIPRHFDVT